MKEVYTSKFVEDTYDQAQSLMVSRWFNAIELTNEIYRTEMIKHVEAVERCRPRYMLINTADFVNFAISPEVQEWASIEIFPRLMKAGIQKMAFVVSPDIITQMAIEQQEDQTRDIQQTDLAETLRSFGNEAEAITWLRVRLPAKALKV